MTEGECHLTLYHAALVVFVAADCAEYRRQVRCYRSGHEDKERQPHTDL